MANVKITELAQETNPASDDVLPIVDVDAASGGGETKKVTIADLLENAGDGSASAPAFAFDDDSNTGIYRPGADQLAISTGGTSRLFIDSSGRLLIGTTTEGEGNADNLTIADSGNCGITIRSGTSGAGNIFFSDGTSGSDEARGSVEYNHASNFLKFNTDATERLRIDSSGRLFVGTSSSSGVGARLQAIGDTAAQFHRGVNAASGASITISKSRNTTYGSYTIVQDDDLVGTVVFRADDGTDYNSTAALIGCHVDGTPGANDMPGRLVFSTTPSGSSSPTERLRIDSSGRLLIGSSVSMHPDADDINIAGSGNIGLTFRCPTTAQSAIYFADGVNGHDRERGKVVYDHSDNSLRLHTNVGERLRVTDTGKLLVNTTSTVGTDAIFQVSHNNFTNLAELSRTGNDLYPANLNLTKNRGSATAIVQNDDLIGSIRFQASDGVDMASLAGSITCAVDGAPGANDMPGRLIFSTTADGSSSPTERMRIDAEGALSIFNGAAPTASATNGVKLYAEDVSSSSELKVRDEAGNVTTLSPHNFDLIPEGPSEDMAWSYYSERDGKRINVDMLKAVRLLEQLSGEKLVFTS